MRGPKGTHTYRFYRPCICVILVCKTGRRLFQSPYGVCTGPHCIRRDTFQNLWGTLPGSCYTGPKIGRTHREPGERMWQLHRMRVISYGLPTDHSLIWLPKSYEPGHTRVSHACDLSIRYFMSRCYEALGQYTGPVRAKPVQTREKSQACFASPHNVSMNFELCRISRG